MARILQPIKLWIKHFAFGGISLQLCDNEVVDAKKNFAKAIRISHFVESIKFCHAFTLALSTVTVSVRSAYKSKSFSLEKIAN